MTAAAHYKARRCACPHGCYRLISATRPRARLCKSCTRGRCKVTAKGNARTASTTAKIHAPHGAVIWRGPSPVDGAPLAAVITFRSANTKTKRKGGAADGEVAGGGNMAQTWILRTDQHPCEVVAAGADRSICGACPYRSPASGGCGGCYVVVAQGPANVYRSLAAGAYPDRDPSTLGHELAGRKVRIGAYGDPAMVPTRIWEAVAVRSAGWTGYTHARGESYCDPGLRRLCMASADSPEGAAAALAAGWRYFGVAVDAADAARFPHAVRCLADPTGPLAAAGREVGCADCGLCNGIPVDKRARVRSAVIVTHGAGSSGLRRWRAEVARA